MNAGKNCIILHSVRTQKPYSDKFCSENLTKYINKLINYWSSIPLSIRVQSVVTKLMATQRGTKLHWTKNEPPYFVKKKKSTIWSNTINYNRTTWCQFVCAFAKYRKATISCVMCVPPPTRLSIFPFALNKLAPTGRIFMEVNIWKFFEGESRKLNLMFVGPCIILITEE